jgi:MFS transporter, ACS family, DAL5 transporter family protein
LLGKLLDPVTWISIITVVMGLAATLQALSNSIMGTAAARFIGGLSQGTFSATIPLYYTYWYTREEMALRMALYVGVGASLGTLLFENC